MDSPDIKRRSAQVEQIKTENFLPRLYDKINRELVKNGGQVIREFHIPATIENWVQSQNPLGVQTEYSQLDLIKAAYIRDNKKDFLLVLGKDTGNRYFHRAGALCLYFAFFPIKKEPLTGQRFLGTPLLSSPDDLKSLVNPNLPSELGNGNFYVIPELGYLGVSCWANESRFGGKELDHLPGRQIFTEEGLEKAHEVVRRTIKYAYKGNDLT